MSSATHQAPPRRGGARCAEAPRRTHRAPWVTPYAAAGSRHRTSTIHRAEHTLSHGYADLGEVRLHYVEAGTGPLVVLLHGFPEFWYSWRHQLPALAGAGFHVVAPDMRGYNLSEKPRGVRAYRQDALAGDVAALIGHRGGERATVVGHDWGGAVGWATAMRHPEVVERLAILNVPHPRRMAEGLRQAGQLKRSWYMFFFQLPLLPEALLRATRYAPFRRGLERDPVRSGAFSPEEIKAFTRAWSQPGAVSSGLNYYRAAFRQRPRRAMSQMTRIDAPVLIIWGELDRFLSPELAKPGEDLVPNARVERIPDASHWVQNDAPDRINRLLLEFLGAR